MPVWRTVLGALAGSAALLLGLLYGLGAAVESRRLANAHVSVLDALPQIPLPHLLGEGIGLALRSFVALIIVTIVVLGLTWAERYLEPLRQAIRRHTRIVRSLAVRVNANLSAVQADVGARQKLEADVIEVQRLLPELTETPATESERQEMLAKLADAQRVLVEYRESTDTPDVLLKRVNEAKRANRRMLLRLRAQALGFRFIVKSVRWGPLLVGVALSLVVAPAPVGVALIAAGLLWRLDPFENLRPLLLSLYVIIAAGVIVNGVIWVPPLPTAHVVTARKTYSGPLVSLTDSTWYIAITDRGVAVVPASNATSAGYVSGSASPEPTLPEAFLNALS
jgi:hypothetical protein